MLSTGRVAQKAENDTRSSLATSQLTDVELNLLDAFYRKTNTRYSSLCREYAHALQKATNERRKSTFPTMPQWIPLGGYQIGDKEYLCGPQNQVHIHNKVVTEDLQTGRMVHYSAAQYETSTSLSSSTFL